MCRCLRGGMDLERRSAFSDRKRPSRSRFDGYARPARGRFGPDGYRLETARVDAHSDLRKRQACRPRRRYRSDLATRMVVHTRKICYETSDFRRKRHVPGSTRACKRRIQRERVSLLGAAWPKTRNVKDSRRFIFWATCGFLLRRHRGAAARGPLGAVFDLGSAKRSGKGRSWSRSNFLDSRRGFS